MKKLLLIAFAAFCCATSQAAYLYWQVETDVASEWGANYAVLHDVKSSSIIGSSAVGTVTATDLTGYLGDFYIELFNYEQGGTAESVAVSGSMSYTQLAELGAITTTLVSIPTAWTGGSYAAPEPTSALLMLIGMAGLALKRRKA